MSLTRRVVDPVRRLFALNQGQWAIGRGIRTAFALLVPVVVGDLLNQPLFAWAGLGGWLGSLADKGGSYRTRALAMGALLVLGSACSYAGTLAAHVALVAVLSMFVVAVLGGLGRAYGDEGSTVGLFIAVLYAVAEGSTSGPPNSAGLRAALFAGGVVWAMVLSLVVWPLHPFRPARRAVARCYHNLARLARALEELSAGSSTQRVELARSLHAEVRSALEDARAVLAGTRRPRAGRSPRGEQLLVLTEGADQLFGTLIAIEAELEAAYESGSTDDDQAFASAFACVAQELDAVATAVDDTTDPRESPLPDTAALAVSPSAPNVHLRSAATQLSRLAGDIAVLTNIAARIDARASSVVPPSAAPERAPHERRDALAWLRPLREALQPRSLAMRHALRMGIAAAAAVWLSYALDITRGYWATITVLLVLQPYAGATIRKTLQRVAGSVAGGILAAVLAVVARSKLAIAGVMFPLTVGAVAALPVNYGVFVLLLTPVFVLLAEPHPGDWGIAGLRVVNTLIGGAIALAAAQVLWPVRETATYAPQLGAQLRALRGQLLTVLGPGDAWRSAADEARRHFGVAVTNAEATLQRLITEDSPTAQRVEAAMTLNTYSRRMSATLSALAASRASGELMPPAGTADSLAERLDALAAALDGAGAPLPPEPAIANVTGVTVDTPSLRDAQLERLRTQFAVLQRAVARYLAA